MNYALIENGIVTNIIWLNPANAADFPNAVPIQYISVAIDDTYENGIFYHNGERILSYLEFKEKENAEIKAELENVRAESEAIIAELDTALLNLVYENLTGGIE